MRIRKDKISQNEVELDSEKYQVVPQKEKN
jgi:hypothetical protein